MGAGRGFLATLRVFAARQNCVSVGTPSGGSATAHLFTQWLWSAAPANCWEPSNTGAGAEADTAVKSAPKVTEPERVHACAHARTRTHMHIDFKKCTTRESRVKFYLEQNEDSRLGDSISKGQQWLMIRSL